MTSSRKNSSTNSPSSKPPRSFNRKFLYSSILFVFLGVIAFITYSIQSESPEYGFKIPLREGLHSPPYIYTLDITVENQLKRIPPTSGNHFEALSPWGFLGTPVVPENAVHNMEHGGVVLWYKPNNPALAGSVNQLIDHIGRKCIVAGSYKDMSYEISATVWGRILPLEKFDATQLKDFIAKYRGTQGPEAPLCKSQS